MEISEVPAEFAVNYTQSNNSATNEDVIAAYQAANPAPVVETPIVETPIVETPIVETPVVETPEPTPTPTFDWSKYGVSGEDELTARLSEANELKEKFKAVEQDLAVLPQVKNPFANDTLMQLNNFISKTGINDLALASEVIGANIDTLKSDPIKAMALELAISDPKMAAMGMAKLSEYVAQKNGVDLSEYKGEGYELPVTLQVDGLRALDAIENKKKEFATNDNFFVSLQNKATEQQREFAEKQGKWDVIIPNLRSSVKALTVDVDTQVEGVGKVSLNIAVSEQDVQSALEGLKQAGLFNMASPDEKGVAAVRGVLENNLRLANMETIIRESVKAAEGKIREGIVKENHNIAPVTTPRTTTTPNEKVVSAAEQAVNTNFGRG